jgi:hypothetical protein
MEDISALRDSDLIKSVVLLVILNIFVSYGVLYLSKVVGFYFPFLGSASNSFVLGIFLSSVIVSPISEELIFRGVLFNRLKIITPTVFAVLISSLLFGSLHGFGGIFSAFVFGITVAVLYLEYDNIFVPILAHFLNNLIAEIIVVLDPNKILFTDYYVIAAVSVLAIVSFIVLAHLLIHELKVLYNNEV